MISHQTNSEKIKMDNIRGVFIRMKAYHLRRTLSDSIIDSIFIPEYRTLQSYIQMPEHKLIVNYSGKDIYSNKSFLERAQAVVDGKKDEVSWEIVNEIEIDEKTAKKIARAKGGFNKYLEAAGSTDNLIRIFSDSSRNFFTTLFDITI